MECDPRISTEMSDQRPWRQYDADVNGIVKEYLERSRFDESAAVFQEECKHRGKLISEPALVDCSENKLSIEKTMLGAFDRGQGDRFFQLWREHLPASLRDQESSSRKLEFYLHIYFAIYPLTKNEENNDQNKAKVEDCMKIFKNYIENRGSVLAQTTEFLPYYALPFVKNPASHPSFDVLFKEDWSKHQRTQLESLLTSSMWAHAQPPKLVELFMKSLSEKKDLSRQKSKLNNSLSVAERNLSIALKKYNRLQMDYENLIEISHELVDQLESTVKGLPIEPDYLKQVCDKLFQSRTMRSKRSSDVSENAPGTPRSIQSGNDKFVEHVPLDYSKMKCDLGGTNDRRKALLLQALRWRLTRAPSDHRDKVMTAYVKNDLLGCVSSGTHKIAVLNLLKSSKSEVREYTVRLLNTFASLALGRTHMMQCPELVKTLFLCIRHEQRCISREMMLGTLQKLSLRRVLQSVMIQEGMLEWLVETLRDHDSLSDYTLEYAIALFMNLCLRTAGKYRCEAMPQETLRVLTDLLGHENVEIRPYVNGALYSLLSVPSIREAAHVMSLQEVLEGFRGDSDADMRRQVEYIIRQLNNAEKNETESDIDDDEEDEDDEEDLDTMEADLDKEEVLFPNPSELTGETLLQVEYIAPSSKVKKAKKTQSDTSTSKSEVLRRPTTPRLHNKGLRGTNMASKDFDSLPAMIHRSADFPAIHRNGTVELSCAESHGQGAPLWRQSSSLSLQAGESRRTSPRPSTESPWASKETSPRKPKAIPPRLQDCVSPRLQDSVSPRLQDCVSPRLQDCVSPRLQDCVSPRVHTPIVPHRDPKAEKLLARTLGLSRPMQAADDVQSVKPSSKALQNLQGEEASISDYEVIFSTRSKISRSPDLTTLNASLRSSTKSRSSTNTAAPSHLNVSGFS